MKDSAVVSVLGPIDQFQELKSVCYNFYNEGEVLFDQGNIIFFSIVKSCILKRTQMSISEIYLRL